MATPLTYKIVIVGDGGVGKTTFVNRFFTGEFRKEHYATLGVEVTPIAISTSMGTIMLNVWDCAGTKRFRGLGDGYYIQANAAIVMFDVTNPTSYKNVSEWVREFRKVCPHAPIVLCGNKVDVMGRKVSPGEITIHKNPVYKIREYYDISAKSNYNFDRPFTAVARILTGDKNLMLTDWAPIRSPSPQVDRSLVEKYIEEILAREGGSGGESEDGAGPA